MCAQRAYGWNLCRLDRALTAPLMRALIERPRRFVRRLIGSNKGTAAVEFAIVAAPFFLMLGAIMELALVFVVDSVLDNATIQTGRMIRTGQASAQSFDAARFKKEVCSRMSVFSSDCESRATVDVRVIGAFNAKVPDPSKPEELKDCYDGGGPGSLVLARVWYRQTVITPLMDQAVARVGDNRATLLRSATAFKNEPFSQSGPAGKACS